MPFAIFIIFFLSLIFLMITLYVYVEYKTEIEFLIIIIFHLIFKLNSAQEKGIDKRQL